MFFIATIDSGLIIKTFLIYSLNFYILISLICKQNDLHQYVSFLIYSGNNKLQKISLVINCISYGIIMRQAPIIICNLEARLIEARRRFLYVKFAQLIYFMAFDLFLKM